MTQRKITRDKICFLLIGSGSIFHVQGRYCNLEVQWSLSILWVLLSLPQYTVDFRYIAISSFFYLTDQSFRDKKTISKKT